jgi:hypothetical protein
MVFIVFGFDEVRERSLDGDLKDDEEFKELKINFSRFEGVRWSLNSFVFLPFEYDMTDGKALISLKSSGRKLKSSYSTSTTIILSNKLSRLSCKS